MKKIITLQIILLIVLSSNAVGLITLKENIDDEKIILESNSDYYIIEKIPYAWQEEIIFCEFACVEMVLRYYGINISQDEIIYSVGGGYSAACQPKIKAAITPPRIRIPLKLKFWTGETTGGTDDYEFLAQIFGLTFKNLYYKQIINHAKIWDEYWTNVKNFINNDIPIITGLDATAWPIYADLINLTWTPPKILGGTHIVLVVGYNETDQTICVNDPCVGYFNLSQIQKGYYRWIDIEVFKKAVRRIYWELKETRYQILVFENTTNEPLPEKLVAQLIQEKNLKKMQGIESAYDNDFVNKNFKKYGIEAVKQLKEDLEKVLVLRIPLHKIIFQTNPFYAFFDPIHRLEKCFRYESMFKNRVSELLERKQDLYSQHINHSIFLKREAKCWENLSIIANKVKEIIDGNNSIKAIKLVKPLVKEMSDQLGDIILLQQTILELPRN